MESIISFPGFGIEGFSVNTVAFSVFGRSITWYGIIVTLGIICGFLYALFRSRYEKIISDDMLDFAIYGVIFGVIGARLYYVAMKHENYHSLYDVVAVWNGGLAVYGGIIAAFITAFVVSRIKKIHFAKIFDIVGPSFMLGQIIGRWGNFVNAEAYGNDTALPWRMGIKNYYHPNTIYVHPTFLYESLWNLLGFILINIFYKKKKFDGEVFLWYVAWYGFGRMFIEGLRVDSLYIGPFRVSQMLAMISCAAAVALLIILRTKLKDDPDAVAADAYYTAASKKRSSDKKDASEEAEKKDDDGTAEDDAGDSGSGAENEEGGEVDPDPGSSDDEPEEVETPEDSSVSEASDPNEAADAAAETGDDGTAEEEAAEAEKPEEGPDGADAPETDEESEKETKSEDN